MKTKHTSPPWIYDEGGFAHRGTVRQSRDRRTRGYIRAVEKDSAGNNRAVARVTDVFGNQDANAAFIVRAVNCHEELLATLKAFQKAGNAGLLKIEADGIWNQLEEAIAKAEGK